MPLKSSTQNGELRIQHTPDLAARLFGLPFLLVGAYFLYNLILAPLTYLAEGDFNGLLKSLPGLILVIVMMLAFGVPGLLLVFGSKRVRIDTRRMEVTDTQNYFLFKREQSYLTSDFRVVDVRYTANRSSNSRRRNIPTHDIYLVGRGKKSVFLATYPLKEQAEALAFGQQIASLLRLPMLDRTEDDNPETLSDEDLDNLPRT